MGVSSNDAWTKIKIKTEKRYRQVVHCAGRLAEVMEVLVPAACVCALCAQARARMRARSRMLASLESDDRVVLDYSAGDLRPLEIVAHLSNSMIESYLTTCVSHLAN